MEKIKPTAVRVAFITALIIFCVWGANLDAEANSFQAPAGDPLKEPVVIRATCYTAGEGALCSTGVGVHEGVVAASKEWEGMACMLYAFEYIDDEAVPTECIGLFTVLDTGAGIDTDGDGVGDSIKNGNSIDVFMPTGNAAAEFTAKYGDYVLMMLIPGGG